MIPTISAELKVEALNAIQQHFAHRFPLLNEETHTAAAEQVFATAWTTASKLCSYYVAPVVQLPQFAKNSRLENEVLELRASARAQYETIHQTHLSMALMADTGDGPVMPKELANRIISECFPHQPA
jgi:hypothetical protein